VLVYPKLTPKEDCPILMLNWRRKLPMKPLSTKVEDGHAFT
jgi:hypothetical protein